MTDETGIAVAKAPAPIRPGEFTREQIELVKATIARGASDDELSLFLYQAKRLGLDPLSRQIHFVKRWDSDLGREVGVAQTAIDGFRLIASRTGRYRPDDEPPKYEYDTQGNLVSAIVKVWTYFPDTREWFKVPAVAYFREYAQYKKSGELTRMWAKMPHVMLAKVCEALALRKAFPAELSSVYAFEEFGKTEEEVAQGDGENGDPAAKPDPGTAKPEIVRPATLEQRQMMHQLWKTRHRLSELSFKRWLAHEYKTTETKTLNFDQAKSIIKFIQGAPTDVVVDLLRSIPPLPEEEQAVKAQEGMQPAPGAEQTRL